MSLVNICLGNGDLARSRACRLRAPHAREGIYTVLLKENRVSPSTRIRHHESKVSREPCYDLADSAIGI